MLIENTSVTENLTLINTVEDIMEKFRGCMIKQLSLWKSIEIIQRKNINYQLFAPETERREQDSLGFCRVLDKSKKSATTNGN